MNQCTVKWAQCDKTQSSVLWSDAADDAQRPVYSVLYSVQCTLQCAVYSVLYSVQCTIQCIVYSTVCSVQCTLQCAVYSTVYSVLYSVQCEVYSTVFSVHASSVQHLIVFLLMQTRGYCTCHFLS